MIIHCMVHVFKSCPWIITCHGLRLNDSKKSVPGNPWVKDTDSDSSIGTWYLGIQMSMPAWRTTESDIACLTLSLRNIIGTISWWLQPQLHPVKCKHVISHNQYHWMLLLYKQLVSDHQPFSSHFRRCWGTLLLGLLPASGLLLPTKV